MDLDLSVESECNEEVSKSEMIACKFRSGQKVTSKSKKVVNDEYVQDSEDVDEESDMSKKELPFSPDNNLSKKNPTKKKINHSYEHDQNNEELEVEFLKKLHIPNSSDGGKNYKKEGCCPYCKGVFTRLDRHLKSHIKQFKTVQKLFSLPARCKERLEIFKKLRLEGNAIYNNDPILNHTGKLLVTRRLINKNRRKTKTEETAENDNVSNEDTNEKENLGKEDITCNLEEEIEKEMLDFEEKVDESTEEIIKNRL